MAMETRIRQVSNVSSHGVETRIKLVDEGSVTNGKFRDEDTRIRLVSNEISHGSENRVRLVSDGRS